MKARARARMVCNLHYKSGPCSVLLNRMTVPPYFEQFAIARDEFKCPEIGSREAKKKQAHSAIPIEYVNRTLASKQIKQTNLAQQTPDRNRNPLLGGFKQAVC